VSNYLSGTMVSMTPHKIALGFFLIAVLLVLDEIRLGVPAFQISDILAPRFTHEKFVVLFALGGLFTMIMQRKKKEHA
jgi:hypothetical protein